MAKLDYTLFDADGVPCGAGDLFLPDYLDWMPIRAKGFWFLQRGLGDPKGRYVLLKSQGEQLLREIEFPLRNLTHLEVKEKDHGLEDLVDRYCEEHRISRVPRNQ